MRHLSMSSLWPMSLQPYFFSIFVLLRRGVMELWWAPGIKSGSTHHNIFLSLLLCSWFSNCKPHGRLKADGFELMSSFWAYWECRKERVKINIYSGSLTHLDSMSYFWQLMLMKYPRKTRQIHVAQSDRRKIRKAIYKEIRPVILIVIQILPKC